MKTIRFNADWAFKLGSQIDELSTFGFSKYSDASGAAGRFYDHNNWEKVDLPHDWVPALQKDINANTFAGAYPNTHYHRFYAERRTNLTKIDNIGWYRKQFAYAKEIEYMSIMTVLRQLLL